MILIENEFKHKGVNFKIIRRGHYALLLKAEAPFYDCESVEVWKIRYSKKSKFKGITIDERERKPSNECYPTYASQYLKKRYTSYQEMIDKATLRFNRYEEEGKLNKSKEV